MNSHHILSFITQRQNAFKNVCTHVQPICFVRVPVILHPFQSFMFLDLLIFTNQVGVKWHLIVVLIGISLITKEVESFHTTVLGAFYLNLFMCLLVIMLSC